MRVARFLLLSLLGVAALTVSAFMSWIDDRAATSLPARDLFGVTGDDAGFLASIGLVLLVVAAVALVATLSVSRWLMTVAGVAGLAVVVLWIVQMLMDDASLADFDAGVWVALGGSVLMLLAAWLGRAPRPRAQGSGASTR